MRHVQLDRTVLCPYILAANQHFFLFTYSIPWYDFGSRWLKNSMFVHPNIYIFEYNETKMIIFHFQKDSFGPYEKSRLFGMLECSKFQVSVLELCYQRTIGASPLECSIGNILIARL